MYMISNDVVNLIEINKSKFITCLYRINSIDDVKNYLNQIKKQYSGATHYCYAYILKNNIKCSDDKEPSGTAGKIILNVLTQNNLNYILCVVVRYFGGIKLGSGGLIRAYSNSTVKALEKCKIIPIVIGTKIKLSIDYNDVDSVNYVLEKSNVVYKEFSDKVIYEVIVSDDTLEKLKKYDYEVIEKSIIGDL